MPSAAGTPRTSNEKKVPPGSSSGSGFWRSPPSCRAAAGYPGSSTSLRNVMGEGKATLTIRRDSAADIQQREVILSLDGERIGRMLYGQKLTREIPAGQHR